MNTDITDNNAELSWLLQQLLPSFKAHQETMKGVLYNELRQGCIEDLASNSNYRLLFLMEGKVFLRNEGMGKYLLYGGNFSLLPPDCPISCASLTRSRYLIVTCTGLSSTGNQSFMEELRNASCSSFASVTSLPIREQLDTILYNFATYTCNEYQYPDIYDTLFVILRILYTPEELVSLLSPMLQ